MEQKYVKLLKKLLESPAAGRCDVYENLLAAAANAVRAKSRTAAAQFFFYNRAARDFVLLPNPGTRQQVEFAIRELESVHGSP